jgi:hypothetical protein
MEACEMCMMASRFMARSNEFAKYMAALCEQMCNACAAECEKHKDMVQRKMCMEACKSCAGECRKMSLA